MRQSPFGSVVAIIISISIMPSDYVSNNRQQQPVTLVDDLSFDEVAKLFPAPIAEAATILGVATSDLKRICRENGVPRWPYRKILAGKTVEDIKREAAKERALLEVMARAPQLHGSNPTRVIKSGSSTLVTQVPGEGERMNSESVRHEPGGPAHGYTLHAPSLRPLHIDHRPQLHHQFHLRVNVPTYLDEFKHGFPRKGLSIVSNQWWGNAVSDKREDQKLDNVGEDTSVKFSVGPLDGRPDKQADREQELNCSNAKFRESSREGNYTADLMPASILARTRKNAATNGRRALGIAVTRGYGAYRLGEKDEALLKAVFEDSLPTLWRASLLA